VLTILANRPIERQDGNSKVIINKMGIKGMIEKYIQNVACIHLKGRDYLVMRAFMGG
jgi:preprotein translocase subunit SecA